MDVLNTKQISSIFDDKYKLVIPNKLSNTITCVAENCLVTKKIENQLISTINDSVTKLELNNKTDEFVSVKLDQSSKINATSYKIFEDSIKTIGEKIIDVLQVIINPNIKANNSSVSSQKGNKPSTNDLSIAVKETIEDKEIRKNISITNCNNRMLYKVGELLISIQNNGIIYSSDGENWLKVEGEVSSKAIVISFKFLNNIIVWTADNSFYYSSNGINWTKISDPNNYINSNTNIEDIKILENDILLIADGNLYYINNSFSILYVDQYSLCSDDDKITKCSISNFNMMSKNSFCYSIDHFYVGAEWIRDY